MSSTDFKEGEIHNVQVQMLFCIQQRQVLCQCVCVFAKLKHL